MALKLCIRLAICVAFTASFGVNWSLRKEFKGEVAPITSELKNYLSEQKIAPLATGITMRSKKKKPK
jgi:hypothetical protein